MGGILLTTSPTPGQVRTRLLAISAALAVAQPTILRRVLFDDLEQLIAAGSPASGILAADCALTAADLPALVALSVGGAPERVSAGTSQRLITRTYVFLVLFYKLDSATVDEQLAAQAAASARIDELPDYFAHHTNERLRFNGAGLGNLEAIGHLADSGIENPTIWMGETFQHVIYTLPVTTRRA